MGDGIIVTIYLPARTAMMLEELKRLDNRTRSGLVTLLVEQAYDRRVLVSNTGLLSSEPAHSPPPLPGPGKAGQPCDGDQNKEQGIGNRE